ncbi:[protein-PII] uridylyltransferase [Neisseria sp. Ec49-e6-T10]|uniref:[protein-PII] uridylyltransferase n=1 Tax=Neisseria sp. Ec49-e6-T10 TaxID=3140744 RepID=UPI003EB6E88C
MVNTQDISHYYQNQFAILVQQYRQKPHPHQFLKQHTDLVKDVLTQIWQLYVGAFPHLTLIATGGFGRAELYPYSDLDLAIISLHELTADEEQAASTFIQALWDMRFSPAPKIGSCTQLLESAQNDLEADTAFLESSFITGNRSLFHVFLEQLAYQRNVVAFCEGKILEQEQRHFKQQSSGTQLEPNIKTCPGGLRDIHTIIWIAKAQGLSIDLDNLVSRKILTKDEARLLLHSHKQLARLRIDLHLETSRAEEHFIFDLQTQIATIWGFKNEPKRLGCEQLMQAFFRATKTIKQLNQILVPVFRSRLYSPFPRVVTELDEYFYQVGHLLAVKDLSLFDQHPHFIFKAFEHIQTNKNLTGFAPRCLRALWHARRKINLHFQEDPENRKRFIQFFIHGQGLTHTLRMLNLYDILGRYLPAFGKIVGLMQFDLFHIYPVDDHILMVVRNLRRLTMDMYSHELPQLSALMQNFHQKHILYLAALFHDIAKGREGDHANEGITDAKNFALAHFLNQEETELLTWLVQAHLVMSQTAQKEDIQDPEVIKRFCQTVQTQTRLTALYLLTCADMRGTNPKIWNSWKASLLANLFQSASNLLKSQHSANTQLAPQTLKENITETLKQQGYSEAEQQTLWQTLGDTYFIRHPKNDILWHARHLMGQEQQTLIASRILEGSQTIQVMVYTPDKPRTFAKLCQFFDAQSLDILDARVFTSMDDFVLDTFTLQDLNKSQTELSYLSEQITQQLHDFLEYNHKISLPQQKTSRRLRYFPIIPSITLIPEEEPYFFHLEVIAGDLPGALNKIAHLFSEFRVRLYYAKIITLGDRLEDSFLIHCPQLSETKTQLAFKKQLYDIFV